MQRRRQFTGQHVGRPAKRCSLCGRQGGPYWGIKWERRAQGWYLVAGCEMAPDG